MPARVAMVAFLSALVVGISIGRAGEAPLVRKTYQVADLVIPVSEKAPAMTTEEQLIKLLTRTIAPASWSARGGPGTIEFFPQTYGLVINQTPDIQDQVQDLLQALRRLQDQQVAVEVKLVEVPEEAFQELKRLGLLKAEDRDNVSFLEDGEVRRLIERIQQDAAASVTQTPKQTAFNGQTARLDVANEQSFVTGVDIRSHDGIIAAEPKSEVVPMGIRMSLRPIISADRRFVRLSLSLKWNSLVSDKIPLFPVTAPIGQVENSPSDVKPVVFTQYIQQPRINKLRLERMVVIPDGRTAVLTGMKKKCEVRTDLGSGAVLSKNPYVGRLFRNVGYSSETRHVLVLVTPRIIVVREQEENKPRATPCPGSD